MPSDNNELGAPFALKAVVGLVLCFLYIPIVAIAFNAFRESHGDVAEYTTKWFSQAFSRSDVIDAVLLSLNVAALSAVIAIVLGTSAAIAVNGYRFRGREWANFLFNLPIALPGIITGIALLSMFKLLSFEPSMATLVVGHTTFCIVLVFSNVIARLRRIPGSLVEAATDLGATGLQAFIFVVLPNLATSIFAGGILAFALSFDEIIITTFTAGSQQTLPIWLLNQLAKPREAPVTNAVALMVIGITTIPIILAWSLTRGTEDGEGAIK